MADYMLLLYAPDGDEAERTRRWGELPLWNEVTESLRDAGLLVANSPLHGPETATTVRVRAGDTELTDGPFAVTKEVLAGYYILRCDDLDQAVKARQRRGAQPVAIVVRAHRLAPDGASSQKA